MGAAGVFDLGVSGRRDFCGVCGCCDRGDCDANKSMPTGMDGVGGGINSISCLLLGLFRLMLMAILEGRTLFSDTGAAAAIGVAIGPVTKGGVATSTQLGRLEGNAFAGPLYGVLWHCNGYEKQSNV